MAEFFIPMWPPSPDQTETEWERDKRTILEYSDIDLLWAFWAGVKYVQEGFLSGVEDNAEDMANTGHRPNPLGRRGLWERSY